MMNPNRPDFRFRENLVKDAAFSISQPVKLLRGGNDREIKESIEYVAKSNIRAILFSADPSFNSRRHFIVDIMNKHKIPAMYGLREIVEAGGLASYGTNMVEICRGAGTYTARVLRGEAPADLPVRLPDKFELIVNRRAADELGLPLPESFATQADEILE